MKKWMEKLIEQFDFDWKTSNSAAPDAESRPNISEELATLLYLIDMYNKHLIEVDSHPVRKTRESFDEFAKLILNSQPQEREKALFRLRQFFSSYRLAEHSYIEKTFDDFKNIIWDFVDELSVDLLQEQFQNSEVQSSLEQLKEAVEANSIDQLKTNARHFIDTYVEIQSKNSERFDRRVTAIQKNLDKVQKKLVEANHSMNIDHLTKAFNRKSFEERMNMVLRLTKASMKPASLLMLDIDHFKHVNDTYGHAMGDFVLVELVEMLKGCFNKDTDFVARLGGEEFSVLLSDQGLSEAVDRAQDLINRVRSEVFVKDDMQLSFTISIGVAQLEDGEDMDAWMKRADEALYASKNNGRNRYTVAPHKKTIFKVA